MPTTKCSEETREKIRQALKGRKFTQEHRNNLSKSLKGHKISLITRIKIGGSNHYLWKGDKAGLKPIHQWVTRWKGKPQICVDCGATREERRLAWSNIDHTYKRNLNDYSARCYPCHKRYDIENN